MPQAAGHFVPSTWANPRPPMFGQGVSVVTAVGGGDAAHLFKRQPEPGARAWALLPTMPKMAFSLAGPGYIVRNNGASQILSGPQVTWTGAQIASGINGQVYGGGYQQGLIDYQAFLTGQATSPVGAGRG